jgi:ribosomal protein S18 acetylase RimI-like enzyme
MQKHDGDAEAFRALRLRSATSEDEAFLLNLFATTRSDELALINWEKNQKRAFIVMQFKAQSQQYVMRYPHAQNSIILWNDDPIGRLLLDRGELEFTLVDVALLPAYRGTGIGTHLIEDLVKQATALGKPIRLHVYASSAAKRLYERLGFSQIGGDAAYLEMMWVPPGSRSD